MKIFRFAKCVAFWTERRIYLFHQDPKEDFYVHADAMTPHFDLTRDHEGVMPDGDMWEEVEQEASTPFHHWIITRIKEYRESKERKYSLWADLFNSVALTWSPLTGYESAHMTELETEWMAGVSRLLADDLYDWEYGRESLKNEKNFKHALSKLERGRFHIFETTSTLFACVDFDEGKALLRCADQFGNDRFKKLLQTLVEMVQDKLNS